MDAPNPLMSLRSSATGDLLRGKVGRRAILPCRYCDMRFKQQGTLASSSFLEVATDRKDLLLGPCSIHL